MQKYKVAILGASGAVGQELLKLLEGHPIFEPHYLAASKQSAKKSFQEAIYGRERHLFSSKILEKEVHAVGEDHKSLFDCSLIFSALKSAAAEEFEEAYAQKGFALISSASAQRKKSDVPLLIPEINPEHLKLIDIQQKKRGTKGFLLAKPNCSIQSYLPALFALHQIFPVKACLVTTLQAISGAGYPGLSALDITNNVIPHIAGEEEKSQSEPKKILGQFDGARILENQEIAFSVQCNRVHVIEGHLASVSLKFCEKKPKQEEILEIWETFEAEPQKCRLPSAPKKALIYHRDPKRPQPRLDSPEGMAIHLGSLKDCPVLDYRFVCLSNNMQRGAAGGAILSAELLAKKGYLHGT